MQLTEREHAGHIQTPAPPVKGSQETGEVEDLGLKDPGQQHRFTATESYSEFFNG